jgi:hypothetical protein
MEAGGGSALPCDTPDGVMLRCSKRGWPRKSAHADKAGLKAHEKASFCRELDDTRCDPRKDRAIPRARVDCCNAKSCDVPQASVAICERSPLVDGELGEARAGGATELDTATEDRRVVVPAPACPPRRASGPELNEG